MTLDLDRKVGHKLGFQAKLIDTNAMTDRQTWCLLDPGGEIYCDGQALSSTEESVWERFFPHYSTDLNAAMGLLPADTGEQTFFLRQYEAGWLASITDTTRKTRDGFGTFEGVGSTPAEAVCRAWLEWQKS